jgi:hypothetical protein
VTHARPAQAATPRQTYPLWSSSLGERSARLPCAVPFGRRGRAPRRTGPGIWLRIGSRLQRALSGLVARVRRRGDRGDVPGWVLVTLMTAGLVLVLWGVARDRLTEVFNNAIDGVIGGAR